MTERVHNVFALQRTFRRTIGQCARSVSGRLRGMERELWNMAPEQRTEQGKGCEAATGSACYSGQGY